MLRLGIVTVALIGASMASTLTSSPAPRATTVVTLVERFGLPHNTATQLVIRKNRGGTPILFVDTHIATPVQLQVALNFARVQHQNLGDKPTKDFEAVPRVSTAATTANVADTPQLRRMAMYLRALANHDLVNIKGIGKVRAIGIAMQAARVSS